MLIHQRYWDRQGKASDGNFMHRSAKGRKGLACRYSKSVSKGILSRTPCAAASFARETQSETSSLALSVTCTPCNGAAEHQGGEHLSPASCHWFCITPRRSKVLLADALINCLSAPLADSASQASHVPALSNTAGKKALQRTCIGLQHVGQEVQDLAARKPLGEGLDGVPSVQEYNSIACLQGQHCP